MYKNNSQSLDHMHCERCHYSLRGLDVESDCPECGLAVRESFFDFRKARRMIILSATFLAFIAIQVIAFILAFDIPSLFYHPVRVGGWIIYSNLMPGGSGPSHPDPIILSAATLCIMLILLFKKRARTAIQRTR